MDMKYIQFIYEWYGIITCHTRRKPMKNLLVLAVLVSSSVMAGERVVIQDQKTLDAEVSNKTVRCSARGYGVEELKINIKGLSGWTMLDHSNRIFGDSGEPCMTAGMCAGAFGDGFSIDDVLQNNPRTEKITVFRKLTESRHISNQSSDDCLRTFTEELKTTVGGIAFDHKRSSNQDVLPAEACTF
jgi:hypothetical protein